MTTIIRTVIKSSILEVEIPAIHEDYNSGNNADDYVVGG